MSTIPLLSVVEAAKQLGLSPRRIQKFCEEKRIGQKVGDVYVIPEDELRKFARQERQPGRPRQKSA